MKKGRSKPQPDIVHQLRYNRPFQSAVFILALMLLSAGVYFFVPSYYVEVKETSAAGTAQHNGTYDFLGNPSSGTGDRDLQDRVSYKLQSSWYQNSRMFIIVGLLLGIVVYAGTALLIFMGKRSGMWPSLLIAMGYLPPALVLLGCFRQLGDHLSFFNLNTVYETLGLPWNITVMFPSLYLVALMNVLILASLWYLYWAQTRPTKKDIASKDLRHSYQDMQKLLLVIAIASILGIVFTPLLPWVTNSQRQSVGTHMEEVSYGYTQHQFYNIERGESDFLSSEEIDYRVLLLRKEESLFKPDDNFTSSSGGTRSGSSAGYVDLKANNSQPAISGIERDRTFNGISLRIFQVSLLFWVSLLVSIAGLFGINLLRDKRTARTGKQLIMFSYLSFLVCLVVAVLHLLIILDVSTLNGYNVDMGIATNQYSWWFNFLPATVAVLIMIISVVFAKRSFIRMRYF